MKLSKNSRLCCFFCIRIRKNALLYTCLYMYRFMYNTCGLCSNLKGGRGMLHKERESWGKNRMNKISI